MTQSLGLEVCFGFFGGKVKHRNRRAMAMERGNEEAPWAQRGMITTIHWHPASKCKKFKDAVTITRPCLPGSGDPAFDRVSDLQIPQGLVTPEHGDTIGSQAEVWLQRP